MTYPNGSNLRRQQRLRKVLLISQPPKLISEALEEYTEKNTKPLSETEDWNRRDTENTEESTQWCPERKQRKAKISWPQATIAEGITVTVSQGFWKHTSCSWKLRIVLSKCFPGLSDFGLTFPIDFCYSSHAATIGRCLVYCNNNATEVISTHQRLHTRRSYISIRKNTLLNEKNQLPGFLLDYGTAIF